MRGGERKAVPLGRPDAPPPVNGGLLKFKSFDAERKPIITRNEVLKGVEY